MNSSRVAACALRNEQAVRAYGPGRPIHCERHFSSRLPPSGGTWKYAKAPSTKKTWIDSLPIDMLLSAVFFLVVAQSSSEIPGGLMNNPVYQACDLLFHKQAEVRLQTIVNVCRSKA